MLAYCESENLKKFENAWLALKPTLNSVFVTNGLSKHSPDTIAAMSNIMSGSNNPFFGKTHSPEQRLAMSMSRKDRIEIYQYTPEYQYTGKHFLSINHAVREGAHLGGIQRVLASGGTSRGYRYSIHAPVLSTVTGKMVLPKSAVVQDPFGGTGSTKLVPVQVTRDGSDILQCFVGIRRAVTVIGSQELWPGFSVSRPSVLSAQRKAVSGKFNVKGFNFEVITREQFMS